MRITSKGQVTIPIRMRKDLGMLPESEVRFRVSGSKLIIEKVEGEQGRGTRLIDRMRGRASSRMSTDEIMALTRGK